MRGKLGMRALLWMGCAVWAASGAAEQAYWVEFQGPPAAIVYVDALKGGGAKDTARKRAQDQVQANQAEQAAALSSLKSAKGASVLFSVQRVLNAAAVRVGEGQEAWLRALPSVKSIEPLHPARLNNATSVPFIGAPAFWESLPEGLTGRGVSIGIIDTGVDYLHRDFGGTGGADLYDRNDGTVLGDVSYPTAKVVGGYDFVGDAYDVFDPAHRDPVPDPDPMDQNGHGTHVAGSAAGMGVTNTNAAYTGPYGASTPFDTLQIGPGVAPEALIYALKVFGAGGDSEIIVPAIEWSADPDGDGDFSDHLDVINMSLGESFGGADGAFARAADNVSAVGVVVVASAGNDGDTYGVLGAPGSAASAISVAACEHENPNGSGLVANRLAGYTSRGPAIVARGSAELRQKPDITAPGSRIVSAALGSSASQSLASLRSGTSMAAPHVAGAAALVRQRNPEFTPQQVKSLLMSTASPALFVYRSGAGGTWPVPPSRGGAGRLDLAALASAQVMVSAPATIQIGLNGDAGPEFDGDDVVTVTLSNLGGTAATFRPRIDAVAEIPGLAISVDDAEVVVPPNAAVEVAIRVELTAALLTQPRERTASSNYGGFYRHFLSAAEGFVTFVPQDGGQQVRTPYYALVRPRFEAQDPAEELLYERDLPPTLEGAITQPGSTGAYGVTELITPLQLLHLDLEPADATGRPMASLQMAGVGLSIRDGGTLPADPNLTFGVATKRPWVTPHMLRVMVFIDTNFDGNIDFTLRNGFTRGNSGGAPMYSDAFTSELYDAEGALKAVRLLNGFAPDGPVGAPGKNTALMRSNVMALPLRIADLGLPEAQENIQFVVQTAIDPLISLDGLQFVDAAPRQDFSEGITRWFRVSVRRAGLGFPQDGGDVPLPETRAALEAMPLHYDAAALAAMGVFDTQGVREFGVPGVMLLHHHELAGYQGGYRLLISLGDTDRDGISDEAEQGYAEEYPAPAGVNPYFINEDSDADSVPDSYEGMGDPDGDGAPNFLDLDADADTLSDFAEYTSGASDPYSADTDGDGLRDDVEGDGDPDGDEAPNARDLDSDGDGIGDGVEGVDDRDGDGVPAFLDDDSDGDGLLDAVEGTDDIDGDQAPNYLDLDSDGDSLADGAEAAFGADPYARDTDTDGVDDAAEIAAGRNPAVKDPPAAPLGVTVLKVECDLLIRWPAAPGATEYRLKRVLKPADGSPVFTAAEVLQDWGGVLSFTDATALLSRPALRRGCSVEPARTFEYAYFVEARNEAGASPPSQPVLAQRTCDLP